MNSRHIIVSGLGLSLLAGGCASDAPFGSQPARRRFEVSPTGVSDQNSEVPAARPVAQSAGLDSPLNAVQQKVNSAREALAVATPAHLIPVPPPESPTPTVAAPAPVASPAPVAPAATAVVAPPPPNVEWLSPDRLTLSNTPPVHPPVAPVPQPVQPPPPAPASDPVRVPVEAGAGLANAGSQLIHPPLPPAPAPGPVPASDRIPASSSNDPAFPSLTGGISATAVADPDPLGTKFGQRMRDYPTDVSAHLDYQMLRFLRDEPVPQLDTISTLPSEDRDLLTAVMDGLSNFRSGLRANRNMLLSEKVKPIIDLADRVRSQAELTIPVLAICNKVQGFGVYDPMPTTLRAGVDNPLIIYCEVGNFSSQQDDKGMWETKLTQDAVLYTDTGYPAWRDKSDIPLDLCRHRRHDFFVVKKVTLPRALNIGRYNLKVSIVDQQVQRIAENSIPIELMAQ